MSIVLGHSCIIMQYSYNLNTRQNLMASVVCAREFMGVQIELFVNLD